MKLFSLRPPFLLAAGALSGLLLSGCASLWTPPQAGESEAQVIARLGQPGDIYQDGKDHLLSYPGGAFGQYSYMARIGADGKLISYQQVWTLQNFQSIQIDHATQRDVLLLLGRPTEVTRYARVPYDVWNYGFKESGTWNSQMSVYFDAQGIVRKVENGPDPRFDDSRMRF